MRSRAIVLAAVLMMAPLGVKAADLVVCRPRRRARLWKVIVRADIMRWLCGALLLLGIASARDAAAAAAIVSYAIVRDDATLLVRGKTIRLYGVSIADARPFCDATFRPARCQTRAAVALTSRIQGFVRCVPQVEYDDRSIGAFCSVKGTGTPSREIDLGAYLIERGWAVALPQAPFAYHTLEEIAKVQGRGVWGFQADRIIIR
jgi:endonuclease YncB( thermonuclease family)